MTNINIDQTIQDISVTVDDNTNNIVVSVSNGCECTDSTITNQNSIIIGNYYHIENYDYFVRIEHFVVNGVEHIGLIEDTITLSSADPTDDRIDVIVVNDDNTISVVEGTPAVNPIKPDIDDVTQVEVTFVLVEAGTTAPTGVTNNLIYNENLQESGGEWDTSTPDSPRVILDSTEQAYLGTKSIKFDNSVSGDRVFFDYSSPFNGGDVTNIILRIYIDFAPSSSQRFWLRFYNTAGADGVGIMINHGQFGYDALTFGEWQTIIIPSTILGISTRYFDRIRFDNRSVGFIGYLDNIVVQSGTNSIDNTLQTAEETSVDTTNFSNNLSSDDDNVQKALNTLDDVILGTGDMSKSVYDPSTVESDVFDMDNMVESATKKIFTDTERTKLSNIEENADVTDAENVEDAITSSSADTLTDTSVIPFIKAATLVKITWLNFKSTIKTYADTLYLAIASFLEENLTGTSTYDATMAGTVDLDLETFVSHYGILTGNTTITVSNTPSSGESFVRNLTIKSTATETLTLPVSWVVIGEYTATTDENYFTIEFSNFPTVGAKVICYINQDD